MTTKKILAFILGGALLVVPMVASADTDELINKGKNLEQQGWQLEKKGENMEKRGESGASDVKKRGKDLQKTGAALTDDAKSAERKVEDKSHDTFHRDAVVDHRADVDHRVDGKPGVFERRGDVVEKKTTTTTVKKVKPHRTRFDRAHDRAAR